MRKGHTRARGSLGLCGELLGLPTLTPPYLAGVLLESEEGKRLCGSREEGFKAD